MEAAEGQPPEVLIPELRRKLRLVTQEAKSFGDAAQVQIRKQRAAVDKLSRDNENLKRELLQAREALSQQQNALLGSRMQSLNEQCHALVHDISEEKREETAILENINILENSVKKCRQRMGSLGGVYAAEVTTEAIAKQTRILENRLDKALQRHSQATAHNKKLKEAINSLRKERVTFDALYKKVESDLIAEKKAVVQLIEEANEAYTARDEAQKQIALIKSEEARERKNFDAEWAHLQQFLESLQMRQWSRRQAQRLADLQARRAANIEHEGLCKNDTWSTTEDFSTLCDGSKLASYQAAFSKIQAATGINSVEKLVEAFKVAEDHNFSLFSYVNSLSNEVEAQECEIHKLHAELEACTQSQRAEMSKKKHVLRAWEDQSEAMDSRIKALESANVSAVDQLHDIMNKTKIMFELVGGGCRCSEELWAQEEVTETTITNYLQAIEEAVDDMVQQLLQPPSGADQQQQQQTVGGGNNNNNNNNHNNNNNNSAKHATFRAKSVLQIKLPSAVNRASSLDTSDDDEAEARPLAREELKKKVEKNKIKREEREKAKQKRASTATR